VAGRQGDQAPPLAGIRDAGGGGAARRLELVGGLGGLAIIGLGVTLAFTGRKD
jgi:hypothetical protein